MPTLNHLTQRLYRYPNRHLRLSCLRASSTIVALLSMFVFTTSDLGTNHLYASELPQRINFKNILANKDIAIGEVEAILQDHEGYIWLGGRNALLRYDGHNFEQFYIADESGLNSPKPAIHIIDLFEDSRKRLWVGTRTGVVYLDRKQQALRKLKNNNNIDTANTLFESSSGEILVGHYQGISAINPETLTSTYIDIPFNASHKLRNIVVYDIISAGDNQHFWLGTNKGLSKLHWESKTFQHFTPNPQKLNSSADNAVRIIAQGIHKNELWLGVHNGVYRYLIHNNTFRQYMHDPSDRFSLGGNLTQSIVTDSLGLTWIGSDGGGINIYNRHNDRFAHFRHQETVKESLASNSIVAIYEDRNQDIWIGTYPEGVNFFDRSSTAMLLYSRDKLNSNTIPHNSILTIQEDQKGNLWLGTDGGGLSYFNRESQHFTHYTKENSALGSNGILDSAIAQDGTVWIGTWASGINRFNPETQQLEQLPFDKELNSQGNGNYNALNAESVWSIREDKTTGELWIGTHTGGLNRYNPKTGVFTAYTQDDSALASQLVWTTYEDSQGRFWVGTADGLSLFNRKTGKALNFRTRDNRSGLSNNSVLSIYEDSMNRLWFGTDEGLNLLDEKKQTFTVFGKKDGFAEEGIRSIVEDKSGDLWLSTNNGLVQFNPDTKTVKNLQRYGGENIGGFNTNAAILSQRGEFITGGVNGLRIINIPELGINEIAPSVVLTGFNVFTKPVQINDESGLLKQAINYTPAITLSHKETMFSFDFSALNYRDSDRNQYAYKLKGFDKHWREVGNQNSAIYTNLDAGTYTFMVKGSNNDGIWSKHPKTISVIQKPPPWQTWWAYALYILIAFNMIGQFIYRQLKKRKSIENQNRILESRIAERTQELASKHNDIKAMLSNMRQGLFTIKIDGNIHPEYSSYLEKIFHTSNIADSNATELLFQNAVINSDNLNQGIEAINAILGEDEISFISNSHALPTEYCIIHNNAEQHLSLAWDPIVKGDIIEKLMVSVRDTTQLKIMEAAAANQERELSIISQLIPIPDRKYQSFKQTTASFIKENREIIKSYDKSPEVIAQLFRNMHTLKGNCRTYGFSYLSEVIHNTETTYDNLRKFEHYAWNKDALLKELDSAEKAVIEYHKIYHGILRRGSNGDQCHSLIDTQTLESIRNLIHQASQKMANLNKMTELQSAKILLDIALSEPLSGVLEDIIHTLPATAKKLNKKTPDIVIDDSNIRINTPAYELINNVFTHILRNSLDHGIEPPEERLAKAKPAAGRICIESECQQRQLLLRISDDGRGIDINRLFTKGKKMGQWSDHDAPSSQEIADFIFVSGASVKDTVSAISGRGVGMDAVKSFLKKAGGDIQLQLLKESPSKEGYIPFEFIIYLPESTFVEIRYAF